MNKKVIILVRQALVASIYVVITLLTSSFSYLGVQFRIAEILILLCFYKKEYMIGSILGCFIANLFSPMLLYDITFGVFASVISVIAISHSKNIYIAIIYPVIFNGLIVALELKLALQLPYWLSLMQVAIGELTVMIFGVIIFKLLEKNTKFMYYITNDKKYNS